MAGHMLTTADNPYDPFTRFDEWFQYDESKGYHTTAYLARVVKSSDELSEADQMQAIEQGIDEILEFDEAGIYLKVDETTVQGLLGSA
jgi:hypothetical protein